MNLDSILTGRRRILLPFGIAIVYLFFYSNWLVRDTRSLSQRGPQFEPGVLSDDDFFWRKVPEHYPVGWMKPLPSGPPRQLWRVQADFAPESAADRAVRLERQAAVKEAFRRSWASYREQAWGHDELLPTNGGFRDPFGGWAATLVDSLDTLLIMNMTSEYEEAARFVARNVSFGDPAGSTWANEVNIFETTIRYMGGFLAAYDLTGDQRMLRKAREVGDMLYKAFDTPNRLPISRWDMLKAAHGAQQVAPEFSNVAEVGSLCVEFTRLSLITGDPKWWDATERIRTLLEQQQISTQLPGMWPLTIKPREGRFDVDGTFGLGALADSTFEYLPKMTALLGGREPSYQKMYSFAMQTVKKSILWKPMTPDGADILVSGTVHMAERSRTGGMMVPELEYSGQHLVCFAGGMFALGGKLTNKKDHLDTAKKLVDGCIWTYQNTPTGIMPETFTMVPCSKRASSCTWSERSWQAAVMRQHGYSATSSADVVARVIAEKELPKGFVTVPSTGYHLRPEAIESIFVLYRTTGDPQLLEAAWDMFQAIQAHTKTRYANSAIGDVLTQDGEHVQMMNTMESFWLGETLKYFYLIFSEPEFLSLDDFVFNTEAHPLRRLK